MGGTLETVTNSKEVSIEKTNVDGKVKATIKTTINGKEDIQSFEGTDAVQAKIDAAKYQYLVNKNALQFARHFISCFLFNFTLSFGESRSSEENNPQLCIDSIENVSQSSDYPQRCCLIYN
jgi:hypothetical protein